MAKVKAHLNGMSAQVKVAGTVAATETATLQTLLKEEKTALDKVEDYIKVPLTPKPCNSTA
jgi:GH24 family phage-related lysozyme (muramidase)